MDRRSYIAVIGTVAATGLAGCVDEFGTSDDENGDDGNETDDGTENGGTENEGNEEETENEGETEDEDHGAVAAVESYVEAGADGDLEAMSEAMHTHAPFDPAEFAAEAEENEDLEFTFESGELEDYEVELADESYDTDDIADIPHVEFWFQDVSLEEVLEGEEAALVETVIETTEDGETTEETETVIALTDDGEWSVFMPYEEPPEIPDDDPVDDDAYRVVEDVTFDAGTEMAQIHLERSPEITAEEVIGYSTSHETDTSVYHGEDVDPTGLPATMFTVPFDPEGDEIVVTVVVDGEERVVHRETYDP